MENNTDYTKQKKFFQKAYDLGEERIGAGYGWPLEVDPQVVEFLDRIKQLATPKKVLDIGCGQGRHTLLFAQQELEAYGVDYVPRAIKEANQLAKEKNLENAHFLAMDILQLDFPRQSFDIVLDWSVLDHIKPEDWEIYLQSILRVLKTDGFLILVEFSANDERIKGNAENFTLNNDLYNHYFREEEIKNLFSKNFEILLMNESMLETPPPHLMVNILLRRKA